MGSSSILSAMGVIWAGKRATPATKLNDLNAEKGPKNPKTFLCPQCRKYITVRLEAGPSWSGRSPSWSSTGAGTGELARQELEQELEASVKPHLFPESWGGLTSVFLELEG